MRMWTEYRSAKTAGPTKAAKEAGSTKSARRRQS